MEFQKLSVKAAAFSAGILWAFGVFFVGAVNLFRGDYGMTFLELLRSVYPGFHNAQTLGSVIIASLYALVDGAVAGALFAWLYNRFVCKKSS